MKFLSHPLPFLIAYCALQGLNALYFSLKGYEATDIAQWGRLEWLLNAWLGVGIAVVGAFISFFDQKFTRWLEERKNGKGTLTTTTNSAITISPTITNPPTTDPPKS